MKKPLAWILLCTFAFFVLSGSTTSNSTINQQNSAFTSAIENSMTRMQLLQTDADGQGNSYITVTIKEDISSLYGFLKGLKLKSEPSDTWKSDLPVGGLAYVINIKTNDGKMHTGTFFSGLLTFDGKWYKVDKNYFSKLRNYYKAYFKIYKPTPFKGDWDSDINSWQNSVFTSAFENSIEQMQLMYLGVGDITVMKKDDISDFYDFLKGLKLKDEPPDDLMHDMPGECAYSMSIITKDGKKRIGVFGGNLLEFDGKWYKVDNDYFSMIREFYKAYFKVYNPTLYKLFGD